MSIQKIESLEKEISSLLNVENFVKVSTESGVELKSVYDEIVAEELAEKRTEIKAKLKESRKMHRDTFKQIENEKKAFDQKVNEIHNKLYQNLEKVKKELVDFNNEILGK